jgi:hypothetical protein
MIDLEAIRTLCEFATDGPWSAEYSCEPDTSYIVANIDGTDRCIFVANENEHDNTESNAEFIASARTIIPLLSDEIDRLTRECDAAIKDARDYAHRSCYICAHWQVNRRCKLKENEISSGCGGFNLWQWRGVQEGGGEA